MAARSKDRARALPHESAHKHVTGEALYVDDEARRRPMLSAWPVVSPAAAGRLTAVDASESLRLPGVRCVLTARDIPGRNDIGAIRRDEPLLAEDRVFCHGQLAAVCVGETEEAARAGAARVRVEVEAEPAVCTLDAAVAAERFHTDVSRIATGDVEAALAASAHTLRGTFSFGGQEHFYLETHAAWAEPGEDGAMFVSSSTQHPSEIQAVVAHVLGIPRNLVVVCSPRMGGGFGGKETQGSPWAALAALAAARTGRPVRLRLPRHLDMQLTGKRHPFLARFEAGFEPDGEVRALRIALFSDGGWTLDLSAAIMDRALFHVDNAYRFPNLEVSGRVCRTNLPSNTAFRGFGGPQGMLVTEEVLDRVARRLGLRPEVVRRRNLYATGDRTHYGQLLEDVRIGRIWERLEATSSFGARREEACRFNAAHPHRKRGIAMTPVKFGISFTAGFLNQAGALVHIYQDGSVQVNHGGTEMGQGLHTKILGIAARELGISPTRIRVMPTQTDKVPNTSATAASSGSDLNGQAVRGACARLRDRLAPVAARALAERRGREVSPGEVRFRDGRVERAGDEDDGDDGDDAAALSFDEVALQAYLQQVPLSATGFYRTPDLSYDREAGRGRPFHYFAYGAAVSEVEVSGFTGMYELRRVDILHDVGDSLNPGIDRGQIEGGFIQGMGWLTMEELCHDAEGRLVSVGPSTYKIPGIGDVPVDVRVELLRGAAQTGVIHGSKAVGEPPLMLAISVREALRDAVGAFGPGGAEVALPSPATPEAVFWAVERERARSAPPSDEPR